MRLCYHCRNTWQFGADAACIVSFSVLRTARQRSGHTIDPPFKPLKDNADEGNNRRGAIAPAVIAVAKTCPGWLAAEAECQTPAGQCPSVALFMIAPIRVLFPVGGIICLSVGESNPCAETAVVFCRRRLCGSNGPQTRPGGLSTADRQTSLSGSSWHRSVPWSSSMRCRRCHGKSYVQGQFSK